MQLSQGTFERGPFFLLGGLKTDASLEWFNVFCCQDLFAPSFRKALSQKHWWQVTHSQGGCKGGTKVGRGHSNFWNKKKCVFIKRFESAVLDSVLGPARLARHTWQCPCFSVVPKAMQEVSRGPLRAPYHLKKLFKGQRRGSCWEEWKIILCPWWHII